MQSTDRWPDAIDFGCVSATAGSKGYDAGKNVSGIKRHIAVETQGPRHAIEVSMSRSRSSSAANCTSLRWSSSGGWSNADLRLKKSRRWWKNWQRKLNTSLQFVHLAFLGVLFRRSW